MLSLIRYVKNWIIHFREDGISVRRIDKSPNRGLIVTLKQLEYIWNNREMLNGKRKAIKVTYERMLTGYVIFFMR